MGEKESWEKNWFDIEIVQEQSGLKGRMELATRSGISLNRATQIKDTEELVKRMKDIASSILEKNS
jgi:hypothetical protein